SASDRPTKLPRRRANKNVGRGGSNRHQRHEHEQERPNRHADHRRSIHEHFLSNRYLNTGRCRSACFPSDTRVRIDASSDRARHGPTLPARTHVVGATETTRSRPATRLEPRPESRLHPSPTYNRCRRPTHRTQEATRVSEQQGNAEWNVAEWHGKMLVDRDGER